jgi:hypothetical protein
MKKSLRKDGIVSVYSLYKLFYCRPAGYMYGYGCGSTWGPKMATRQDTCTCAARYGFLRVRVRVWPKVPAGYL